MCKKRHIFPAYAGLNLKVTYTIQQECAGMNPKLVRVKLELRNILRTDGVESTTYNYYYYDTEYSPHMREDSYAKALLQAKLI